ncbi:MAG TPA: hypothetical protein PLE33_04480 [Candidatus Cloacimonas sp.]|nr:hypothetical protein [Candidatus Cloacimonas sp.]HPS60498.1 hypothetical protein [Candidatus Cloacimonas sp.]
MNETLKEVKIRSRMMPGALTITGFLGNDERPLAEIIATDEQELKRLHRSVKEITDRMKYFSNASFDAYNNTVVIDDTYEVHTDTSKGTLTCPYGHGGLYRKYVTTLTNRKNNLTVRWSAMDIHLIEAHHFFEGKGSPYRLEPEILVKAIF